MKKKCILCNREDSVHCPTTIPLYGLETVLLCLVKVESVQCFMCIYGNKTYSVKWIAQYDLLSWLLCRYSWLAAVKQRILYLEKSTIMGPDFIFPFSSHLFPLRLNISMFCSWGQFKSFKVGSNETSHVICVNILLNVPVKKI